MPRASKLVGLVKPLTYAFGFGASAVPTDETGPLQSGLLGIRRSVCDSGRSGASGSAHAPVVPSVGVVAQDRVQVTAIAGVAGAGVKSDPDGVYTLQVNYL